MIEYECLSSNTFQNEEFSLVPLRDQDKFLILKMRNEQIYHLRQEKELTELEQEIYFNNVISKLFSEKNPNQILFTFLEDNEFIGYGGLVHINWKDKNAEISFIMRTELEKTNFSHYWHNFLPLVEEVAFNDLNFHKIYTYAFDLRPHLYPILKQNGFIEEARLKEHYLVEGKYIDIVINAKINKC